MTDTELRIQYAERTWDIEFPEPIEVALENDYVENSVLYTDDVIKYIQVTYLICQKITPQQMVDTVHYYNKNLVTQIKGKISEA